ncbi:hypothetical protein GZH46_02014, partial [Fragariocoptes setiger]
MLCMLMALVASLLQVFEYEYLDSSSCQLLLSPRYMETVLPPFNCSLCSGSNAIVDRMSNLTQEEFEQRYAFTGKPVVVTDAQSNWTARTVFDVDYFIRLYLDENNANEEETPDEEKTCQFFPYKTNFSNLSEALIYVNKTITKFKAQDDNKSEFTRAWYFGWSNCDAGVSQELRKHYRKPYFLPATSYITRTDWIFMGMPGYGAHMHIDRVFKPSWQAQIRGTKVWRLQPPAECYHQCPSIIETIVGAGDTIVLDTNIWYHATEIIGFDISIVIGSEYD